MKIQFSDLISKRERKKEISYTVKLDPFYFEGDKLNVINHVTCQGQATSDSGIVVIKANIKCDLEIKCSRCLDTFIYPIDIDIEEKFTNDIDSDTDDEVTFVKDDVLDITEIIENSIISSLPIKRLCSIDCKGLCQSCGANLNKSACSCNNDDVDLRLEGLRALLNDKEV